VNKSVVRAALRGLSKTSPDGALTLEIVAAIERLEARLLVPEHVQDAPEPAPKSKKSKQKKAE
jgi:hypothetical protein